MPFAVSRSTALVALSVLLVVLALAGHRLAQAGTASSPEVVAPLEPIAQRRLFGEHSSSTSSVRCGGRASIAFVRERESLMPWLALEATGAAELAALNLAAPLVDGVQVLVPIRSASPAGVGSAESDSAPGAAVVQRRRSGPSRVSRRRRPSSSTRSPGWACHRAEDPRLPGRAWAFQVGRRPGRRAGNRPGADRAAARPRDPVRRAVEQHWPSLLVGSACAGRATSGSGVVLALAGLIGLVAVAAFAGGVRIVALAAVLAVGGLWWEASASRQWARTCSSGSSASRPLPSSSSPDRLGRPPGRSVSRPR